MIYLHLGVHKTATTYIQELFLQNLDIIFDAGRAYWPLDLVRPIIASGFDRVIIPRETKLYLLRRLLAHQKPPMQGLQEIVSLFANSIISEENILGFPSDSLGGKLYPNARPRLRLLAKALKGQKVEIFLCVRGYPSFLASLYAEAMRHGFFQPEDQFERQNFPAAWRWFDLVTVVSGCFPDAVIHVWKYEDFSQLQEIIIHRMSGVPLHTMRPLAEGLIRPSASAAAIEAMNSQSEKMTRYQRVLMMASFEKRFPVSGGHEKYRWDCDPESLMDETYAQDVEKLRTIPNVEVFVP